MGEVTWTPWQESAGPQALWQHQAGYMTLILSGTYKLCMIVFEDCLLRCILYWLCCQCNL